MKKAFLLTLLFIISMVVFVSCQKESVVNQQTINENDMMESSTTKSHFDQSVLIKALGEDYNFQGYDKLNEHEKSAIIAQAQDDGLVVSFEDNVMIVEDDEGNTVRFGDEKTDDGDERSNDAQVFLNGILPPPKAGTVKAQGNVSSNEYSAAVTDLSIKQVKAYIKEIKKAGYNVNVFMDEGKTDGLFLFSARNEGGNEVEVSYRNNNMMIDIVVKQ